MRRLTAAVVAFVTVTLGVGIVVPEAAHGVLAKVTLQSTDADLEIFQYVDDQHQRDPDASFSDFIRLTEHRHPARISSLEGTSSAFVNQASTLETPGPQPPFPASPLNDIAVTGRTDASATATGNGPAVPVTDNSGEFQASFTTDGDIPVFFSGAMQTANGDVDSCSTATVELTGPGNLDQTFAAYDGGDCDAPKPHSTSWAQTETLPPGEYDLDVYYEAEVSDDATQEPASMSASAVVDMNLSFFPPSAGFTTKLSGSTAHFNATGSGEGAADRKISKYQWTFGDGKTTTTSKPTVAHRYPAEPNKPAGYVVTMQTVDSGGAVSKVASHEIAGTTTSLAVTKGKKVTATGAVAPSRHGQRVLVALSRKTNGHFQMIASDHVKLDKHSRYATTLQRPAAGRCRIVSSYPGDSSHLSSRAVSIFAC